MGRYVQMGAWGVVILLNLIMLFATIGYDSIYNVNPDCDGSNPACGTPFEPIGEVFGQGDGKGVEVNILTLVAQVPGLITMFFELAVLNYEIIGTGDGMMFYAGWTMKILCIMMVMTSLITVGLSILGRGFA